MKRLIFALFTLMEAHVLPIGLAVTGANVHRKTLVEIVESIHFLLPFPKNILNNIVLIKAAMDTGMITQMYVG